MRITSFNVLDSLYEFMTHLEKYGLKKSEIINYSLYLLCKDVNNNDDSVFLEDMYVFKEYFKKYKKSSKGGKNA